MKYISTRNIYVKVREGKGTKIIYYNPKLQTLVKVLKEL